MTAVQAAIGRIPMRFSMAMLLTFCAGACARLEVPLHPPPFSGKSLSTSTKAGVSVSVEPVVGRARYWELFDEDLAALGIAVIQIEVENNRNEALELGEADFRLHTRIGISTPLSVSKLLQTYYRRKNIRMYTDYADSKARRELENLMFRTDTVGPGSRSSGILFFEIRGANAGFWNQGAIVAVQGLKLSDGTRLKMEVPLHHAKP